MSVRRSNRLIWLVLLLVSGNVSLAVTALCMWQGKERAEYQTTRVAEARDQAMRSHEAVQAQLATLRQKVNHEPDLGFAEILHQVDQDIAEFGTGTPNETYSDIVRRLRTNFESLRGELAQIVSDKQQLQEVFETMEAAKQKAVEVAEADSQEARRELYNEQAEIGRKLSAKDDEISRILDRANTLASRLETEKRDKSKIREELLGQVNKLRTLLVEARAPYTPQALAKQKPDGKVVRASAATRTAWLNIGSRHGIEEQVTFSVQPAGFNGNPFAHPKAKLEVVRVMGPDLCEARITASSLTNPVIEGDEIFNPAWNPGKVTHFALAGSLDIDGDGNDDRAKIRQIILRAGGKIDAEVLPDGTAQGEVTVETNYFVRGIAPDPEKTGAVGLRIIAEMARMERTARDYGAVIIEIGKFLDLMGYTPVERLKTAGTH